MFKNANEKIDNVVYTNSNGEITAEKLNDVLHEICDDAEKAIVDLKDFTEDNINLIDDKQDILISGQNIKTVNGESILGEGDITIECLSGDVVIDNVLSETSNNPVQNKVITQAVNKIQNDIKSIESGGFVWINL
jgi:hypothetical protein